MAEEIGKRGLMKRFIKLNAIILISILLLGNPVYSKDGPNKASSLECAKARYENADKKLNILYKKITSSLNAADKKELKDNEIMWIGNKEYVCGFQSEMLMKNKPEKDPAYYECLAGFTESRIVFLNSYLNKTLTNDICGEYDDGFGGWLEIKKDKENKIQFHISVVRGPTSHTGDIEGTLDINKNAAEYKDTESCKDTQDPCCKLSFKIYNKKIEVKEDNCMYYHGVRAYFDGMYRKMKN